MNNNKQNMFECTEYSNWTSSKNTAAISNMGMRYVSSNDTTNVNEAKMAMRQANDNETQSVIRHKLKKN